MSNVIPELQLISKMKDHFMLNFRYKYQFQRQNFRK